MITQQTLDEINSVARLEEVAADYITFKRAGSGLKGDCPKCNGEGKFTITTAKQIYKCFACDRGGKFATQFLQEMMDKPFNDAVKILADKYNVLIRYEVIDNKPQKAAKKHGGKANGNLPIAMNRMRENGSELFRDAQLKASGISEEAQLGMQRMDDNTEAEVNRYQAKTIDESGRIVQGDDMVMIYLNLDGTQKTYIKPKSSKELPLVRVRWQNPELHEDKHGRSMKYQSPYGSGSHLWLPERLRSAVNAGSQFDTLHVEEGEKKADKKCMHGMMAVGVMGIHNIANKNNLPPEFQQIIKRCGVKNVIFNLDADWQDITSDIKTPVDYRPKSFFRAVANFNRYFTAFANMDIYLNIFFAYIKSEHQQKGTDDLLANTLAGQEEKLAHDFSKAIVDATGAGEFVQVNNITSMSPIKLMEFWSLNHVDDFLKMHFEILKERPFFTFNNIKWKFSEQDEKAVMAQPIAPEEIYWHEENYTNNKGKEVSKLNFYHTGLRWFLFNRNIGRLGITNDDFRFIKIDNNVVTELKPFQIKDFVLEFTENIDKPDVYEMMLRGSRMYLGSEPLGNLKYLQPNFHANDKNCQYLYFKNNCWKITAKGIDEVNLVDLDGCVWSNKLLNHEAERVDPLLIVHTIDEAYLSGLNEEKRHALAPYMGKWDIDFTALGKQCDFLNFLNNASNFHWEKTRGNSNAKLTTEEKIDNDEHFLSKLCAIGYMLHNYRNSNVLKAVICMDGKMSEVGSSNGRTGKSIVSSALKVMIPSMMEMSGKKRDLVEDRFIWEGVDERTQLICIDDLRQNIDFEFFFSNITGNMQVDSKGTKKFTIPQHLTPKLFLTTNHAIEGEGISFKDRQWLIVFSDYYSDKHRPIDEHKRMFFDEWEKSQWNLYFNMMALALQCYFRFGVVQGASERVQMRKMRQKIGETFLDWADTYFNDPYNLHPNIIPRKEMLEKFYEVYPMQKRYVDNRLFKKKLILWCEFRNAEFNPGKEKDGKQFGGDDKTGGIERFCVRKELNEGSSDVPF